MRVLVTGANGFLGRFVVDALLARGHDVRALVRPTSKADGIWRRPVDVVRADLAGPERPGQSGERGPERLDGVFDGVSAVVHLAAAKGGDEQRQFAATAVGTERLLEAMSRSACRRVVLASSITVYDWSTVRSPVDEEAPLAADLEARGGYTRAKVWQERVARRLSGEHGLELTVLRPGILWGPGEPCPDGVTLRVKSLDLVFGIGARLPLTYVENAADCFAVAVDHKTAVGRTFNVVDPVAPPTGRFVRGHLRRTEASGTVITVPYQLGRGAVQVVQGANRVLFGGRGRVPSAFVPARFVARFRPLRFSTESVRTVMGWVPPYDLETARKRTYGRASV